MSRNWNPRPCNNYRHVQNCPIYENNNNYKCFENKDPVHSHNYPQFTDYIFPGNAGRYKRREHFAIYAKSLASQMAVRDGGNAAMRDKSHLALYLLLIHFLYKVIFTKSEHGVYWNNVVSCAQRLAATPLPL